MKTICRSIAAIALAIITTVPAPARTEEENWDRCLQLDKVGPLEPEEIVEACRIVLRMRLIPPNVRNDAFNNMGVAYTRLHELDMAISQYNDALRKIKELPDVSEVRQLGNYTRRNRANAYILAKRYSDALNDYDTMASLEPLPKYLGLRCLAHALYDDNYASALTDCQKAIGIDKTIGDAYAGWLIVEYRQGKYADVKSDCRLVEEKGEPSIDANYVCRLADLRLGIGKVNAAALTSELDQATDHAARFRELGMVP
jgi:tetratricopeptide (TPR) repeat protein